MYGRLCRLSSGCVTDVPFDDEIFDVMTLESGFVFIVRLEGRRARNNSRWQPWMVVASGTLVEYHGQTRVRLIGFSKAEARSQVMS